MHDFSSLQEQLRNLTLMPHQLAMLRLARDISLNKLQHTILSHICDNIPVSVSCNPPEFNIPLTQACSRQMEPSQYHPNMYFQLQHLRYLTSCWVCEVLFTQQCL